MPSESPHRRFDPEVRFEVVCPKQRAFLCVEATQMSLGTQCITLPVLHGRRCARARSVADRIDAVVLVLPEHLAVRFVQAKHSFRSRNFPARESVAWIVAAFGQLSIHDIDASIRHGRTGVSSANLYPP